MLNRTWGGGAGFGARGWPKNGEGQEGKAGGPGARRREGPQKRAKSARPASLWGRPEQDDPPPRGGAAALELEACSPWVPAGIDMVSSIGGRGSRRDGAECGDSRRLPQCMAGRKKIDV